MESETHGPAGEAAMGQGARGKLNPSPRLEPGDALLIVDVQRDFCPGGALPIPEGDRVVDALLPWLREASRANALILASRDWHPPTHVSFVEQGGPWPAHCIQGSRGAEFLPALELPEGAIVISKGQRPDRDACSAFDGTRLTSLLQERGIRRLYVGGLAQDVCVLASVLDALRDGFETHVLVDATRPISQEEGERALRQMEAAGAIFEETHQGTERVLE